MKPAILLRLAALFVAAPFQLHGAMPPADELLPPETLAFFTVADSDKTADFFTNSPAGRLWNDPAMQPFKESVLAEIRESILGSVGKSLPMPLTNLTDFFRGQISLAVIGAELGPGTNTRPKLALIVDVKDKTNELKTALSGFRKQWIASGKRMRNDVVQGVQYSTIWIENQEMSPMTAPSPSSFDSLPSGAPEFENGVIVIAQSGSLFLAGNDVQTLSRISTRALDGGAGTLAGQTDYKAVREYLSRNALLYGWINAKSIAQIAKTQLGGAGPPAGTGLAYALEPARLIDATGLASVESISLKVEGDPRGILLDFSIRIPESQRRGLFKMIAFDSKDASPPEVVPASALNFFRWRWDGPKSWTAMDTMLASISPELTALVDLGLSIAAKEHDPNYDLRKSLAESLGNDIMVFQPASGVGVFNSEPSPLILVASPNPERLAVALHTASALLPFESTDGSGSNEFLGRKMYSVPLVAGTNENRVRVYFSGQPRGYLVFCTDRPWLEAFLSNANTNDPALKDLPGFAAAAGRVGGMTTGLLGYQDLTASMRELMNAAAANGDSIWRMLDPWIGSTGAAAGSAPNASAAPRLLPPFEKISQYFHFGVYAGSSNPEGFNFKYFVPTMP